MTRMDDVKFFRYHQLACHAEADQQSCCAFSGACIRACSGCVLTVAIMKKTYALLALAGAASLAGAADVTGNAQAGAGKRAMCAGCHGIPGYKAAYPEVYLVPMIGGQSARYIQNTLVAYQKGERNHPTMRGVAASLSAQDMADLAAYYAQPSAK